MREVICHECNRHVPLGDGDVISPHFFDEQAEVAKAWVGSLLCPASGETAVYVRVVASVTEAVELFACLPKRADLLGFLRREDIPYRTFPDPDPERTTSITFELGGEHWVATYDEEGLFVRLAWSSC